MLEYFSLALPTILSLCPLDSGAAKAAGARSPAHPAALPDDPGAAADGRDEHRTDARHRQIRRRRRAWADTAAGTDQETRKGEQLGNWQTWWWLRGEGIRIPLDPTAKPHVGYRILLSPMAKHIAGSMMLSDFTAKCGLGL